MRPRALPPGPGISTRLVQAKVRGRVRSFGADVLAVLRPLFLALNGPSKRPETHAERLLAGGALALPTAVGQPMARAELVSWLDRAEYPLLRVVGDSYHLTSGGDVLARAVGAGALSVDVMLRNRDSVGRHTLRITPGITRAQVTSALFDVPEVPSFSDVAREVRGLSAQSVRLANAQVAGLGVGRPFELEPATVRRFQRAGRQGEATAEALAIRARRDMVRLLQANALPAPRRFDPDTDVGRNTGNKLQIRAVTSAEIRAAQAARAVDQETHEAEVDSTKSRYQRLGVGRYKWVSSRDERTRKRHLDMDGNIYSWDDPPEADPGQYYHPGERNHCRCTPSALIEDIMEALEEG